MKLRRLRAIVFAVLAILCVSSAVLAQTYTANISLVESNGNTYGNSPWVLTINNSYLVTQNYMSSSGLDAQVTDSGTNVPRMIVSDRTMFYTTCKCN
jgi:hypothetical protein